MARFEYPDKPRYMARRYIADLTPTERVRQVLWLRAQGWQTTEIAALLHVSRQTVYEWVAQYRAGNPVRTVTGKPRTRQYPTLIDPYGERHTIPADMPVRQFAEQHGVAPWGIEALVHYEQKTHHGWRVAE